MDSLFFICSPDTFTPDMLKAAYVYGLDRTPRPADLRLDDTKSVLILPLSSRESIRMSFPWTIPEVGHQLLSTGTLARQETPYYMSVELARGLCVAVRNQAADWEIAGLTATAEFWETIFDAGRKMHLASCLTLEDSPPRDEIDRLANQSMQLSSHASKILTQLYVDRILALRQSVLQSQQSLNAIQEEGRYSSGEMAEGEENDSVLENEEGDSIGSGTAVHTVEPMPPKWIGARLSSTPLEKEVKDLFLETFNIVSVGTSWARIAAEPAEMDKIQKQVDWCYSNGFYLLGGPLLVFETAEVPEFMKKCRGDFTAICFHVREYVEKVVKRFRNKVKTWIATSRVNTRFPLGLNPIQQLELTARIISWIREFHPTAKIATSIDQPWGDGLLPAPIGEADETENILAPMTCAEILMRSRLGLSSLFLEFNIGYRDLATYDRPLVEWSRMIDSWSLFRLPLYLTLRVPSACTPDPNAVSQTAPLWSGWNTRQQNLWAMTVVPLLLAKPQVHGIGWGVYRDYCVHDYPHAGLISFDGKVKKTLGTLSAIQQLFNMDEF